MNTSSRRASRALLASLLALSAAPAFAQTAQDAAADFYGSFVDYAQSGQQLLERRFHDRSGPCVPGGLQAGYLFGDLDTNDGFDVERHDGFLGYDHAVNESLVLGLVLAGGSGDTALPGAAGDADGFQGLLHGTYRIDEKLSAYATLGYGSYDYDAVRTTLFGVARGSTDGDSYGVSAGATYLAYVRDNLSVVARGGLRFAAAQVDGFTETGSVDRQIVESLSSELLTLDLGASALWSLTAADRPLDLELTFAFEAPLSDQRDDVRAVFVAIPGTYTNSFEDEDVSASLGANAGYQLCEASRLFAGLEGRAGGNEGFYATLGATLRF